MTDGGAAVRMRSAWKWVSFDEAARSMASRDLPLRDQPLVGDADRVARDRQPAGQLARCGEARAARELALEDCLADLPVDLASQVVPAFQANEEIRGAILLDQSLLSKLDL